MEKRPKWIVEAGKGMEDFRSEISGSQSGRPSLVVWPLAARPDG